jgi:hypothetical protein
MVYLGMVVFIFPVILAYFDYREIERKVKLEVKTRSRATFFIMEYLASSILILIAAPIITRGINPFTILSLLSFLTLFPYLLLRSIMRFEQIVGKEVEPAVDLYPRYRKKYEPVMKFAEEAMKFSTPPVMAPVTDLVVETVYHDQKVEKLDLGKAAYLFISSLVCSWFVIEITFNAPLMFGLGYRILYMLVVWVDLCLLYVVLMEIKRRAPAGVWDFLTSQYGGGSFIVALIMILFSAGIFSGVYLGEFVSKEYRNSQITKHPELASCEKFNPIESRGECYARFARKFGEEEICYLAGIYRDECLRVARSKD